MSITKLSVRAVRDGVTYIVMIDPMDQHNRKVGPGEIIEGVIAESEQDAVDKTIAAIRRRGPIMTGPR